MSQLNVWYRTLKNVNREISKDRDISNLFDALKRASRDGDKLEAERTYCVIDEDWVEKIEKELIFVAKAIEEDRQFIVQNGEVLPIEKIKKVSKASVRHLARHSNLITKLPKKGQSLIPSKLYMVENLTDYAVYENRFLYMLLCYLRDFIDSRLQEILEIGNTFRAKLSVKKDIRIKKRHLLYSMEMLDEDKNDPYSHLYSKALPVIEKIENQFHIVLSLLATPLMKEVAKVPMIKPPITKTNVLKMNNNFVHAMELYHYISAYTKKGYEIERIINNYRPINDNIMQEYCTAVAINAFIAYKYGNKMQAMLEEEFKQEEIALKQKEGELLKSKIAKLKAKLSAGDVSLEEYLVTVEERNKMLENIKAEFDKKVDELNEAQLSIEQLNKEKEILEKDIAYYKKEVDDKLERLRIQEDEYRAEMEKTRELREHLNAEHEERMSKIEAEIQSAVDVKSKEAQRQIDEKYTQDKLELEKKYREQKELIEKNKQEEIDAVKKDYLEKKAKNDTDLAKSINELQAVKVELVKTKDEKALFGAELHALRQKYGLSAPVEDFTSNERFNELEMEFEAFAKFFKAHWALAKKRIRREILWKIKNDGENTKPPVEEENK